MNQEKIGKFISEKRKDKKLTQSELAEKLGVTDKSISNWENGRNMPDLSLFKPICEILDISINDLLSGKEVPKNEYQERLEENIISTINYSNKKVIENDYQSLTYTERNNTIIALKGKNYGVLSIDDLAFMYKSIGETLDENEIELLQKKGHLDVNNCMSFQEFRRIMTEEN